MKKLIHLATLFAATVFSFTLAAEKNHKGLQLQAPEITLPDIRHPFSQRETKITPQEYPLAQQLRPLLQQQKYSQALTILEEYKEPKSSALRLLAAQLYTHKKAYDKASAEYQQALEEMPDLIRAHQGLATLSLLNHQEKQAREHLIKAISLGAQQAQSFAQLGYLNMKLGDVQAAIAAYQQALMLSPEDVQNKRALLFALSQGKQFAAADQVLNNLLELSANDRQLWLQRAYISMEQGKTDLALSSAEVAIRLGYKGAGAKQLASQLHLKQGNVQRAVDLSKALYLKGELKFSEVDKLVHYLKRDKQWRFVQQLLAAVAKNKNKLNSTDLSRYYLYQGYYAQSQKQADKASNWFKSAVDKDATNGAALIALAQTKAKQGSLSHAELLYQRAERLEGVKLQAMLARAQLYIDKQDYASALDLLQDVHRTYPQQGNIARNIQSLKNLVNGRTS